MIAYVDSSSTRATWNYPNKEEEQTTMAKIKVELLDAQIHQRKFGYNLVLSLSVTANGITDWARAEYRAVSGEWELSHNGMRIEKALALARWATILPDTTDGLLHLHTQLARFMARDGIMALTAVAKYGQINAEKLAEQNYLFDGFRAFDPARAIIRESEEAV